MRSRDPRNTWGGGIVRGLVGLRVEGGAVRASLHHETKPDAIKGPFRKRGGCAMKVAGLTRGDLRGCPRGPVLLVRGVVRDGDAREGVARRGEVSRGRITSGIDCRWEGPNAKPRCRTLGLVGWTFKAANPKWGLGGSAEGLSPTAPVQSTVHPRRLATPHLTPPRRACGSSSWPAGTSPRRSDASSRTPVPLASTG